jgi:cell division protease FtsH
MKKSNRRRPRLAYRVIPKNLDVMRGMPSTILIDRPIDRWSRTFLDQYPRSAEPAFESDPEDEDAAPKSRAADQDAMMAVVGATFDAAVSRQIRRQIDHAKAMAVVVVVPTPAWVAPVSQHFREKFGSRWCAYNRDGAKRAGLHAPEGSDSVAADLSRGQCVVGLAADAKLLPTTLAAAADITIRLPAPTGPVLRTAIAKFCRRSSEELPCDIAAGLDLHDILSAFRPGTGPQRIAQRLAAGAAVVRGEVGQERLPALSDAVEYGEAQRWGLALARDIADYRAAKLPWADLPRGICLHSKPGCGKTWFPRLLSRACSMPLVETSVADWFTAGDRGTLDQVLWHLRAAFERAQALGQPAILALDECDAVPNRATLDPRNRDFWTPVVAELLLRISESRQLIIICMTNNAAALDPALLRPGRLEKVIEIVRPDFAGTHNMLKFHVNGAIEDAELADIAALAEGSTAAEIMALVREGRRIARHAGRPFAAADLRAVMQRTRRGFAHAQGRKNFEAATPTSPNMVN